MTPPAAAAGTTPAGTTAMPDRPHGSGSGSPSGNGGLLRLVRQAAGYFVTAGLAAIVDIGGFHLLSQHLGSVLLPAVLSFLAAAVVNYTLSSVWVYRSEWRSLRRAAMFLAFACVGLSINAGMTWLLATHLPIHPTLAKVGGVGIAFVANFLMNTFIVFKAPKGR